MLANDGSYQRKKLIEVDGLVIAYVSPQVMRGIYIKDDPEYVVQFKSGTYHPQDWIGKEYGSVVFPRKRRKDMQPLFLLAPTPELWTRVLQHRTQILYNADISLICTFLELAPGHVVLECGTGSGSLTHALARSVAPTGHVHSFEFHAERCKLAQEEFHKHGLHPVVTVTHRDVQMAGFPETLKNQAHGAFLDLPEPWKAVSSAVDCLMSGYSLVTFSPCIEQIQRTCKAMDETGLMIDIRIMECLAKEYKIKEETLIMDLNTYDHKKHNIQEDNTKKRKEQTSQQNTEAKAFIVPKDVKNASVDKDSNIVLNARTVAGKGHTGFLTVSRKLAI